MAEKTKKKVVVTKVPILSDKEKARAVADVTLRPSVNAAAVITEYGKTFGEQSTGDLIDALLVSIEEVSAGDMGRCEAMLMGQAYALQSIFMSLSRRANNQEYMKNYEIYLRLALKAQGQCRATLETLATIKNPPVIYAKQANIANGPQQINNGTAAPSQVGKTENVQSKLLEAQHGNYLDTSTAGATIGADSELATVGEINRAEVARG